MLAELSLFVGRDIVLSDWPPASNLDRVLEEAELRAFRAPEFFIHSDNRVELLTRQQIDIHASFYTRHSDVLLFGPNHQVNVDGLWSCESRAFKQQFLDFVVNEGFRFTYPGSQPPLRASGKVNIVHLPLSDVPNVQIIDDGVFLATPVEPDNWGRWITTVIPKIIYFLTQDSRRKILVRHELEWQRSWLQLLGVSANRLLQHHPGKVYFCKDISTIENSVTNLTINKRERLALSELARSATTHMHNRTPPYVFVSRLGRSKKSPHYRVLANEVELMRKLGDLGFVSFEPENFNLEYQIKMFSNARFIVCLGGAGLFNVVFCPKQTKILTIESSTYFVEGHSAFLSSLDLQYGVVIGAQDMADPEPIHKRWHVDVDLVASAVQALLRA